MKTTFHYLYPSTIQNVAKEINKFAVGGESITSARSDSNQKLTYEEQLFLYLSKYKKNCNNYIVTELITEQGIQNALGCDLGYLSRLLAKNEKEGLIYRKKLTIKEKNRKQNAYFLTEEGSKFSNEINKMKTEL